MSLCEPEEADVDAARARGYLLGKEGAERLVAVDIADLRRQLEASEGCDQVGSHTITCDDCGGFFGWLCDGHADELDRELNVSRAKNTERRLREARVDVGEFDEPAGKE